MSKVELNGNTIQARMTSWNLRFQVRRETSNLHVTPQNMKRGSRRRIVGALIGNDCVDYHLPEALHLQGIANTDVGRLALLAKDVTHCAAGCPFTLRLNLDVHHVCPDDGGIDDGGYSAGIMHRRSGKAIVEAVGIPEEGKEVSYECCYRAIGSSQSLDYGAGRQRLVCHLQRAHGNRPATAKHDSGGLGIEVEVQLGGRGGITQGNCSTHERNGLDLGDDGRLAADGGRAIGEGGGGAKGGGAL